MVITRTLAAAFALATVTIASASIDFSGKWTSYLTTHSTFLSTSNGPLNTIQTELGSSYNFAGELQSLNSSIASGSSDFSISSGNTPTFAIPGLRFLSNGGIIADVTPLTKLMDALANAANAPLQAAVVGSKLSIFGKGTEVTVTGAFDSRVQGTGVTLDLRAITTPISMTGVAIGVFTGSDRARGVALAVSGRPGVMTSIDIYARVWNFHSGLSTASPAYLKLGTIVRFVDFWQFQRVPQP